MCVVVVVVVLQFLQLSWSHVYFGPRNKQRMTSDDPGEDISFHILHVLFFG